MNSLRDYNPGPLLRNNLPEILQKIDLAAIINGIISH
jgi:hypothetical protein